MSVLMHDLLSATHRERYRLYYATTPVQSSPHTWEQAVQAIAQYYQAHSVLDYGSGPGRKLEQHAGLFIKSYDPGVPALAVPPLPADLVVCLHTLEHVEPERLPVVLEHLTDLARKALFVVVSCQPSTKVLPDGLPWHTLVQPGAWWKTQLEALPGFRLVWPFYLPERQEVEWVGLLERID